MVSSVSSLQYYYRLIATTSQASHGHGFPLSGITTAAPARASLKHHSWMCHEGLSAIGFALAAVRCVGAAIGDWRCRRLLGLGGRWCWAVAAVDWRARQCGMPLTQGRDQDDIAREKRKREREKTTPVTV